MHPSNFISGVGYAASLDPVVLEIPAVDRSFAMRKDLHLRITMSSSPISEGAPGVAGFDLSQKAWGGRFIIRSGL